MVFIKKYVVLVYILVTHIFTFDPFERNVFVNSFQV